MNTPASSLDDVAFPEDAVEVGRILGAWGVKGSIKVLPFSSDPQALFSSRRWFLQPPATPRPFKPGAPLLPRLLKITQAKEQGDAIVATAQEVSDRTSAEDLKGARVFVSRASFPTTDSDEFYWVDLMGLSVVNRAGERLGVVADLLDTGAHSVLRVLDDAEPPVERLIPFVSVYIDRVDQAARQITVDWGLDY